MVESNPNVSHVYVSSRRLYIDSHTDDVFGSFGHIGPSPAESALVIDFTRALFRNSKYTYIFFIEYTYRRGGSVRVPPVRSRPLGRVYTIGNRQQLPVFQPSRFAHRGSAGGHLHPPCRPPGRRGKWVLELYTRDPLHRRPIAPALRSHADTGHRTCPCATCTPPCTMLSIMPT
jgi:hypothetical protein